MPGAGPAAAIRVGQSIHPVMQLSGYLGQLSLTLSLLWGLRANPPVPLQQACLDPPAADADSPRVPADEAVNGARFFQPLVWYPSTRHRNHGIRRQDDHLLVG